MTTGALIISWGRPVPGREGKAMESFATAQQHWEDLEKSNEIVSHRAYFGSMRGSAGFAILEGELDRLQGVQRSERFQRVLAKADVSVEDMRVDLVTGGSDAAVQNQMKLYTETLQEAGYL